MRDVGNGVVEFSTEPRYATTASRAELDLAQCQDDLRQAHTVTNWWYGTFAGSFILAVAIYALAQLDKIALAWRRSEIKITPTLVIWVAVVADLLAHAIGYWK